MKVNTDLCNEFKVACEICYLNGIEIAAESAYIADRLCGVLTTWDVVNAVDTLLGWGIISIDADAYSHGRGRLLVISNDSKHMVNELLERYWMQNILDRGE